MQTRPALIALTVPRVSDTAKPEMESYSRHAIVCTGRFCSPQGGGRAIYARLAQMLDREDLLFGPARVKRSEAPCLGVCAGGPVVAVYPEGVWYHSVDIPMLDRIVCEHLRDGRPVQDRVFHQLGTTRPNEPLAKGVKTKQ